MRGKSTEVDMTKIYESNSFGPFKIIEDLGRIPFGNSIRYCVKIKFINTGFETIVRYDMAMDGHVRDDLYGIDFNKEYYSNNYGPYKIIAFAGRNDEGRRLVRIKFKNSGNEEVVLYKLANREIVKDHSVDYKDRALEVPPERYDEYIDRILSSRWHGMMARCYNPNNIAYSRYGGKGLQFVIFGKMKIIL